ncbi:hypothetical protein [Nonomuraea sp. NPDC050783]|uniref:hypothetical protein n=1 Tax=Nonomuraea sp. NPDC050783 TaxID=3154634 RepID=UPI003465E633
MRSAVTWTTKVASVLIATVTVAAAAPPASAAPDPASRDPYLTSGVQAGIQRQDVLVAAADQIRAVVVEGDGYAGIELAGDRVVLWWKGELPEPVRAAVRQAGETAPVEVRPARHSERELREASERLWSVAGVQRGGRVHAVRLPFDGSGLAAAVEEEDAAAVRQSLPDVGVPVEVIAQEPMRLQSRCDDDIPWYGGLAIRNDTFVGGGACGGDANRSYHCTGGYPVYLDSARYLLTAGHCGAPGDWFSDGAGQSIGIAERENVAHDLLLIRMTGLVSTGKGNGRIWDGVPGVNDFTKPVAGWGFTYKNQSLCVSGATSGASCNHVVDYKYGEICGKDIYGNSECYTNMVSAKRPLGSTTNGDSGGPVFELTGAGSQVRAMGSCTGRILKTSLFSKSEWTLFQEFATAVRDFPGLEPALGVTGDPV